MGARILLVDDHVDNLEALGMSLRPPHSTEGYEVTLASNGAQALQLLRDDGPYDLVVTDLAMPVMDGRELLEAIATGASEAGHKPTPRTVPTVLMTAMVVGVDRERIPATEVMIKPCLPSEFRRLIMKLLASR